MKALKREMRPLMVSLWLITPESDFETINSHQILILADKAAETKEKISRGIFNEHEKLMEKCFPSARRDVHHEE